MGNRRNTIGIYALIIIFIVLIVTPFFFRKNLSLGEYLKAVWHIPSILDENQSLRTQIEDIQQEKKCLDDSQPSNDVDTIVAKVYSLYPFNTKNRIFIHKGFKDGVQKGKAVLISKTVLVGVVQEASETRSEIITPYDPLFSLAVRVGEQETDAFLQGGITPRLTLIDKSKQIVSGDLIVSATKEMPYGLILGRVGEVREDASGVFFETTIQMSYNINAIRTVQVLK